MVDATTHDQAWEEALEQVLERYERGEAVNEAQFNALVAEIEARIDSLSHDGDPLAGRLAHLRARASQLEASAAEGTGPTDQVSSMLAGLTGSDGKP